MNPQYTDQFLTDFYSSYQEGDKNHHRYGEAEELRIDLHTMNIIDIEKFVNTGSFLSVGCGGAHDLSAAQARGWEVEGFEVDEAFSRQLSQRLGIPIRSGNFSDLDYPQNHYDCVYLNHVIEHPKNPSTYLRKSYDLLKKGGVMYIACPNIAALSVKLKKVLETLHLKKKKGSYYDSWQHLFYYSPAVMKNLLESEYGFKVLLMGNDRKYKAGQSSFSKNMVNAQAYGFPYKSSFRLIAKKP
ncbi:class I SAM-dependent methyltransferase [Catalinimonas niigatensis]|uniref:class I SAM-dependent methyltransferase n=1 Tax=Catalinimonas niigatensis TaxID=1397264 RepID=UPI00266637FE|nr:class I SAM-dependent methyltransferase [Catalinimonas niigatensis]WPP52545.1 class I SAM-dependent methyltransferase [Catalinimonas niigatensis]